MFFFLETFANLVFQLSIKGGEPLQIKRMATVPLNEDVPSKRVGITADIQAANCKLTSTVCPCPELRPICFTLNTDRNVFLLGCCLLNPSRIQPFLRRKGTTFSLLGCNFFSQQGDALLASAVKPFLPRVHSYFSPRVQLFQFFPLESRLFQTLLGQSLFFLECTLLFHLGYNLFLLWCNFFLSSSRVLPRVYSYFPPMVQLFLPRV